MESLTIGFKGIDGISNVNLMKYATLNKIANTFCTNTIPSINVKSVMYTLNTYRYNGSTCNN